MWLLTRYGSYWISSAGQTTTVRVRRLAHLENPRKRFPELARIEILTAPSGGYRYRLIVPRQRWSAAMEELAQEQESDPGHNGFALLVPPTLDVVSGLHTIGPYFQPSGEFCEDLLQI